MPDNEYARFTEWAKAVYGPVHRMFTPENYRQTPEYNAWVRAGKPSALGEPFALPQTKPELFGPTMPPWNIHGGPVADAGGPAAAPVAAPATAPTPTPTTPPTGEPELTPEEYLSFVSMVWWEDPKFDNATIPEQRDLLMAYVTQYGFNIYSPWYAQALKHKNRLEGEGVKVHLNYNDSGYDYQEDAQGNWSIIGASSLDESELTAAQAAQVEIDLRQLGLSEEQFAFQQQQAGQQLQLQRDELAARAKENELKMAVELAALGDEGWIEQWYARQAKEAQFEDKPKPWYAKGGGIAGIIKWPDMTPSERGDWIRRHRHSQFAKLTPERQEAVIQGYERPVAPSPRPVDTILEPATPPTPYTPPTTLALGFPTDKILEVGGPATPYTRPTPPTTLAAQRLSATAPTPPTTLAAQRLSATAPTLPEVIYPVEEGLSVARRGKTPRPTAPPTPEWLPPFAPYLAVGQPIRKGEIPTPSGQQISRTSPSVLAGLRGFTKWGGAGGRSFEDIMAQTVRMQPRTVLGGRGRLQPVRQV